MKIKSIKLEHTNPSLGPHEKVTLITLPVTEKNAEKINTFLNNSKINNTTILFEYLKAVETNNKQVIDSVLNNAPKNHLNEGQTISNLFFNLENGEVIKLDDVYRKFELSHFYPDFTSYMVETGEVINEISPFDFLNPNISH
ncbi:hypothetical protein [Chondrinema litorale]|uniref:hypothetical protein n=1 Tax=Chondrinema litorale TaxID=2994555 RepID=UPI0025428A11|nr:hypothetical protein [Chondrinema litorale]UZR96358.1 hypothetical protein OQ292_22120 [Chondrinema litorale]